MNTDIRIMLHVCLLVACVAFSDAFFLRWGSDNTQSVAPKAWVPNQISPVSAAYRNYAYQPSVWDNRNVYQATGAMEYSPIPISVPLKASLTPVSLQHVKLVPCMCPVAAEEADKLHEAAGPGPYLAQAQQADQIKQQ